MCYCCFLFGCFTRVLVVSIVKCYWFPLPNNYLVILYCISSKGWQLHYKAEVIHTFPIFTTVMLALQMLLLILLTCTFRVLSYVFNLELIVIRDCELSFPTWMHGEVSNSLLKARSLHGKNKKFSKMYILLNLVC